MTIQNTLAIITSACCFTSAHAATVLYAEDFTTTGTSNEFTSLIGWTSYRGATAGDTLDNEASPRWAAAGSTGVDSSQGFLFLQDSIGVAYEANAFSLLPTNITDFTYQAGNSSTAAEVRFIIQQNGNWYATNSTYTTASKTISQFRTTSETKTHAFTLAAADWRELTITPGTGYTLSGAPLAADLSATDAITSIGFYASGANAIYRMDNLQINGIPEPSALLLLGLAAPAALRRKR
ncbi:MAG: PEP-CTERM sorting domain-containing protein [Verrucomicrobiales bacterium]